MKKKLMILIIILIVLDIILLIIPSFIKEAKEEKDDANSYKYVEYGDEKRIIVKIYLNGADKVEQEELTCDLDLKDECIVHLPKAYRDKGEVIGYSVNPKNKEAEYKIDTDITVNKNLELYVISKKENVLHIDNSSIDYLSKNDLKCSMYNNEPCDVILPMYNKKGYEIFGYTDKKESTFSNYYPNNKFNLKKDVTLYPLYGSSEHYGIIDVVDSRVYNNNVILELEKGCNSNRLSKAIEELDKLKSFKALYPSNLKINIVSQDTILKKANVTRAVGVTFSGLNMFVDMSCLKDDRDYIHGIVHELVHVADYEYFKIYGKRYSEIEKVKELYEKYKKQYEELVKKYNGDVFYVESRFQMFNLPLNLYAYSAIEANEFLAEAVTFYYLKEIRKDSSYKNIIITDDIKEIVLDFLNYKN